jgi:hypothetical protein
VSTKLAPCTYFWLRPYSGRCANSPYNEDIFALRKPTQCRLLLSPARASLDLPDPKRAATALCVPGRCLGQRSLIGPEPAVGVPSDGKKRASAGRGKAGCKLAFNEEGRRKDAYDYRASEYSEDQGTQGRITSGVDD